jgi:hypothetical protein
MGNLATENRRRIAYAGGSQTFPQALSYLLDRYLLLPQPICKQCGGFSGLLKRRQMPAIFKHM